MILHVRVVATATELRIDIPEAAFTARVANILSVDAEGLMSGFGDQAEAGPAIRLMPIYEPVDFEPEWMHGFLRYYVMKAQSGLRRGLAHVLDLLDRVDWDLHLPGYAAIPLDRRRRFERLLEEFVFSRSYSINGEYRRLPPNFLRR